MNNNFYIKQIKFSDYPSNVIPDKAIYFTEVDVEYGYTTVKGFYDTSNGEIHIQAVKYDKYGNLIADSKLDN